MCTPDTFCQTKRHDCCILLLACATASCLLGGPAQNLSCSKVFSISLNFCQFLLFMDVCTDVWFGGHGTHQIFTSTLPGGISQPISLEQELQEAFAFFCPEEIDIDAHPGMIRSRLALDHPQTPSLCWTIQGHRIFCLHSLEPLYKIVQGTHQHILAYTITLTYHYISLDSTT